MCCFVTLVELGLLDWIRHGLLLELLPSFSRLEKLSARMFGCQLGGDATCATAPGGRSAAPFARQQRGQMSAACSAHEWHEGFHGRLRNVQL